MNHLKTDFLPIESTYIKTAVKSSNLSCLEILSMTRLQLLNTLDLPLECVDKLISTVAKFSLNAMPAPLMQSSPQPRKFSTNIPILDSILYGGLPCNRISELVSDDKTASESFLFQCIIYHLLPPIFHSLEHNFAQSLNSVFIIGTNIKHYPQLIKNMALEIFPKATSKAVKLFLDSIQFVQVSTFQQLVDFFQSWSGNPPSFVGITHITDIIERQRYLYNDAKKWYIQRQSFILRWAETLKSWNEENKTTIFVINRMISRNGIDYATLGTAWAHVVFCRLFLKSSGIDSFSQLATFSLSIEKNPLGKTLNIDVVLNKRGLECLKHLDDDSKSFQLSKSPIHNQDSDSDDLLSFFFQETDDKQENLSIFSPRLAIEDEEFLADFNLDQLVVVNDQKDSDSDSEHSDLEEMNTQPGWFENDDERAWFS